VSTLDEDLHNFKTALRKLPPLWEAIDIRVLAFRIDGIWHNALTRCRLVASAREITTPKFLPETENVRSFHVIRPVSELDSLIGDVATRELQVGGFSIRYERRESYDATSREYNFGWYEGTESRTSHFARDWEPISPRPWRGLTFGGVGNSFSELTRSLPRPERDLDDEVYSLYTPLDGINGIVEHVIGLKSPEFPQDRRTQFTLTAPFETRFDTAGCFLQHGILSVALHSGAPSVRQHINVGYIASNDGDVLVTDTRNAGLEWGSSSSTLKFRIDAVGATAATLLLRLGDQRIERLTVLDSSRLWQNPRQSAYELVDRDLQFMRDELSHSRERKDANDFEQAFARLLTLLGFQTLALGPEKKLSDAIDVIAFDPFGSDVLAVECTTSNINPSGKLGRLHMRAIELADELPEHKIQPVIVTIKPNSTLSDAECHDAARDRIAVLAAEEIDELLNRLGAASPPEILAFIRSKIPVLPQTGSPWPSSTGILGR
jgi:hypothetical protein